MSIVGISEEEKGCSCSSSSWKH
ncbi:hypothetical protein AB3S75_023023 [Citrus x aurantiifolia]